MHASILHGCKNFTEKEEAVSRFLRENVSDLRLVRHSDPDLSIYIGGCQTQETHNQATITTYGDGDTPYMVSIIPIADPANGIIPDSISEADLRTFNISAVRANIGLINHEIAHGLSKDLRENGDRLNQLPFLKLREESAADLFAVATDCILCGDTNYGRLLSQERRFTTLNRQIYIERETVGQADQTKRRRMRDKGSKQTLAYHTSPIIDAFLEQIETGDISLPKSIDYTTKTDLQIYDICSDFANSEVKKMQIGKMIKNAREGKDW